MYTDNIITERLVLKSMTLDDAEIAWSFWGDYEMGKYLCDPYYKDANELRELISDIDQWENEYPFIAYDKNTGDAIATCSIGVEGGPNQWGFGYCVRKDLWGQGYATEIVKALINFAYSLGIRDFQGTVAKENSASRRVMEKCGMHLDHESSFKKNGTDIVYTSCIYKMHLD